MHYWTPTNPCKYCGATSNTTHHPICRDAGLYDKEGHAIPAVPHTHGGTDAPECTPTGIRCRNQERGIMSVEPKKYVRKPFYPNVVQVTEENMAEVAQWCGGTIQEQKRADSDEVRKFIKVAVKRPLTERQTKAFINDWVLEIDGGFRIYTPNAFIASFTEIDGATEAVLHGIFGNPVIPEEEPFTLKGLFETIAGKKDPGKV